MNAIESFDFGNRFLSNFYVFPFEYNGIIYQTAEAAFQAQKTLDENIRKEIALLGPVEAKKVGRRIPLRENWDKIKVDIMYNIVKKKFSYPEMKKKLLGTGIVKLIEGNHWNDTFWGVCRGKGENNLGKILMKVRAELKEENENESNNPT